MKKLVVAFAVLVTAVVASAAVVDWKYEIAGDAGGSASEFVGYTAYLVDAAYYTGLSKVTAESITGTGNYIQKDTLAQTGSSGKGSNKKYVFSTDANTLDVGDKEGTTFNYYLVLVDSTGKNYTATAYNYTARADTASPSADAITLALPAATVNSGMTEFSAVPEPTSALLLMFGVAGLALKRKRA